MRRTEQALRDSRGVWRDGKRVRIRVGSASDGAVSASAMLAWLCLAQKNREGGGWKLGRGWVSSAVGTSGRIECRFDQGTCQFSLVSIKAACEEGRLPRSMDSPAENGGGCSELLKGADIIWDGVGGGSIK